MKSIFTIILLSAVSAFNAQVIIGDAVGTATTKTSVLLEFAKGNKGLILPYVRTLFSPLPATAGTILLDASIPAEARIKFSNGISWVDLSGRDGNVTSALTIQPMGIVETDAKSIIGARSSGSDGVLVLESTTKAMVLPTVADVQDIPSPSPGMMVYINKTGAKRLAVFNGTTWAYWKP
ncbi:hypothetical protein IV494_00310 [Kaistella sp. G5-32]|uniref:Uncharacterized protein n=1 Tax=Kaistella gelatinilytica TaxID=2787636 RepID=A0ABS0F7I5_9FLAO|nr:hypothetical protein [Kaistella gelatinilytica]MBF8455610.1 hypothetical protein [Kaistella gelatinilytica]